MGNGRPYKPMVAIRGVELFLLLRLPGSNHYLQLYGNRASCALSCQISLLLGNRAKTGVFLKISPISYSLAGLTSRDSISSNPTEREMIRSYGDLNLTF